MATENKAPSLSLGNYKFSTQLPSANPIVVSNKNPLFNKTQLNRFTFNTTKPLNTSSLFTSKGLQNAIERAQQKANKEKASASATATLNNNAPPPLSLGGRRRSRHAKKTRRNKRHSKKTRRNRKH